MINEKTIREIVRKKISKDQKKKMLMESYNNKKIKIETRLESGIINEIFKKKISYLLLEDSGSDFSTVADDNQGQSKEDGLMPSMESAFKKIFVGVKPPATSIFDDEEEEETPKTVTGDPKRIKTLKDIIDDKSKTIPDKIKAIKEFHDPVKNPPEGEKTKLDIYTPYRSNVTSEDGKIVIDDIVIEFYRKTNILSPGQDTAPPSIRQEFSKQAMSMADEDYFTYVIVPAINEFLRDGKLNKRGETHPFYKAIGATPSDKEFITALGGAVKLSKVLIEETPKKGTFRKDHKLSELSEKIYKDKNAGVFIYQNAVAVEELKYDGQSIGKNSIKWNYFTYLDRMLVETLSSIESAGIDSSHPNHQKYSGTNPFIAYLDLGNDDFFGQSISSINALPGGKFNFISAEYTGKLAKYGGNISLDSKGKIDPTGINENTKKRIISNAVKSKNISDTEITYMDSGTNKDDLEALIIFREQLRASLKKIDSWAGKNLNRKNFRNIKDKNNKFERFNMHRYIAFLLFSFETSTNAKKLIETFADIENGNQDTGRAFDGFMKFSLDMEKNLVFDLFNLLFYMSINSYKYAKYYKNNGDIKLDRVKEKKHFGPDNTYEAFASRFSKNTFGIPDDIILSGKDDFSDDERAGLFRILYDQRYAVIKKMIGAIVDGMSGYTDAYFAGNKINTDGKTNKKKIINEIKSLYAAID